jgi:hypothetical protein
MRRVVAVVLAVHLGWIALYLALGHEPRDFMRLGKAYVTQSTVSEEIRLDPGYEYASNRDTSKRWLDAGYDGQFFYFMALDPVEARHYMDLPAYRYQRVLYPAAAWAISFGGHADLLPIALILVNLIAVGAGTLVIGRYLRRRGCSPWWAALFGLAPGILLAVQRDLSEPLAFTLTAIGVITLEEGEGRRRAALAGGLFALAALTRQTTLVIPAVYALWQLFGRDVRVPERVLRAALIGGIAALPYALWTLFVRDWLGGTAAGEPADPTPFGWLFARAWEPARQPVIVAFVLVPAFTWAAVALWQLRRGPRRPVWAALALIVLAFFVFAPAYNAYTSTGRIVTGAALMALLAVPFLGELGRLGRRAFLAAGAVWASMIPVVLLYGLTSFGV